MKKIFILMFCLLLTGCTLEYNINIKEGLKVDESAIIKGEIELEEEKGKDEKVQK